MLFIIGGLLIISGFLLARLFYIKKQVKSITEQLTDINENKLDKKVTIGLLNKEIEALTEAVNDTIDVKKECEASKVKLENDIRQRIANMSHDLRTPLTSIIGYIQLMKLEDITHEERKEYLCTAEQRAKALESLLNDFYELSLIDSLDFQMNLEKINLNKVLQEVLVGKYTDFMNRDLQPQIEIPNENIYIIADEKFLERVIENLLSNTIKYAKDKAEVYLGVEENKVLLKISNNITDLTSKDVEKIFDRFYMADKMRSGKGTGLGLAIAKELVEKMKGSIIADISDDVLNICCTFKFYC